MADKKSNAPRIAIPVPHSGEKDYAERSLPQYEHAVRGAGGVPVRIELDQSPAEMMKQIEQCDAVLLPGSKADVDPRKFGEECHDKTGAADPKREAADDLLLNHAYNAHKPILGICYGLQSLNVHQLGSLVQHIEPLLNHSAGRAMSKAHTVEVVPGSLLSGIVGAPNSIAVNSSHHQAAKAVGENLRIVARSTEDGVIEALEGTTPRHFVLAVQWHPERSVKEGPEVAESARAIFRAFIEAARTKHEELAEKLQPHRT
jgi:putative glutamine amidotransferase